jgi:uncharacterized membrane protein
MIAMETRTRRNSEAGPGWRILFGTTLPPRVHRLAALLLFFLFAGAAPASAQFAVCNQTLDAVNLAVATETDGVFSTEGWWTIGANRCADVIKDELVSRYVYVYATDVFGQPILASTVTGENMCVGAKRFTIAGTDSCWERGYQSVHFMEVDTQQMVRWTLFLKEPAPG